MLFNFHSHVFLGECIVIALPNYSLSRITIRHTEDILPPGLSSFCLPIHSECDPDNFTRADVSARFISGDDHRLLLIIDSELLFLGLFYSGYDFLI